MQERHKFNNYELLVQLVPETGENNFQYLIFDWSRKEAISIDCYDSQKVINALDGSDLIACLGWLLSFFIIEKITLNSWHPIKKLIHNFSYTSSLGSYWWYSGAKRGISQFENNQWWWTCKRHDGFNYSRWEYWNWFIWCNSLSDAMSYNGLRVLSFSPVECTFYRRYDFLWRSRKIFWRNGTPNGQGS